MTDELSNWAETVRRDVFDYWKSNFNHWDPGFQVWYGPVDSSKNVLILGIQPGGDEDSFKNKRERFEKGDFSLSKEHDYLSSDFDLARGTQKVVPEEIIKKSVKTNLNFFRAPDESDWKRGLDSQSRREIEEYCFEKVDELVQKLDPDVIITEGTASVYDKLKEKWGFSTDFEQKHNVGESQEERLVCVGHAEGTTVVGLKHPSSGRGLGEDEYQTMRSIVIEKAHVV